MTLPASVRINAQFPFPSLVQANIPVTITKLGGIWTVGFNIANLTANQPPSSRYATDYAIIYDAIANTFFKVSLANFPGVTRTQRSVTSAITVLPTDQILNCNINTPTSVALPAAATRNGVPLTFKDVGAQFSANNLTLTPGGGDTIDGQSSVVLKTSRQAFTINPFTDGFNTGWFVT